MGANAVHALNALSQLGLPVGLLAAYSDQRTEHFQLPVRRLGYQLALDKSRITQRSRPITWIGRDLATVHE